MKRLLLLAVIFAAQIIIAGPTYQSEEDGQLKRGDESPLRRIDDKTTEGGTAMPSTPSFLTENEKKVLADYLDGENAYNKATNARKIAWMNQGMEAVKSLLKDPGSAQFRNVYFHFGAARIPATCGEVNPRNSYRTYGGYQKFVSLGSSDTTTLQGQFKDFAYLWNKVCE